ncbi:hypothetical protein VN97_g10672 [Penicillium thymicola]|uniref:Uncharacterized protein n=1 Tax=Penicillium thymicola TaxID=293382 RepID=A0AAI9T9G3_PENTH|nr:hypothetical protein VN97_g10672 [Penicillium thymicola]
MWDVAVTSDYVGADKADSVIVVLRSSTDRMKFKFQVYNKGNTIRIRPIDGPKDRAQNTTHLRVGLGWALGFSYGLCGGLLPTLSCLTREVNIASFTQFLSCCGGLRPHIGASGINPQDCSYLAVSPLQ